MENIIIEIEYEKYILRNYTMAKNFNQKKDDQTTIFNIIKSIYNT